MPQTLGHSGPVLHRVLVQKQVNLVRFLCKEVIFILLKIFFKIISPIAIPLSFPHAQDFTEIFQRIPFSDANYFSALLKAKALQNSTLH